MVLDPQGPGRVGRRRFLYLSRPFVGGSFSCARSPVGGGGVWIPSKQSASPTGAPGAEPHTTPGVIAPVHGVPARARFLGQRGRVGRTSQVVHDCPLRRRRASSPA